MISFDIVISIIIFGFVIESAAGFKSILGDGRECQTGRHWKSKESN